jgi:signal transduction histidine kinase/ActR/RegA family two-component response regulator
LEVKIPMLLSTGAKTRSVRLLVALATAAAAAIVNDLLWPEFGSRYPLVMFYPAIVATAFLGGAGAGVFCTIASSLIAALVWLSPHASKTVSPAADAVALTVFVTIGALISLLTDISAKRSTRERAARERAERVEGELADELADVVRLQQFIVSVFRREDPTEIVRDLLEIAVELVAAAAAHVHVFDRADGILRLTAQVGRSPRHVNGLTAADDAADPIARAFRLKQEIVVRGEAAGGPHVRLHAVPMIAADGTVLGVLTTYRDGRPLSERRAHFLETSIQQVAQAIERCHLLRAERAAREEAEQASRLKDGFLSTVSHELRTPLNAVLGWAEMLRSGRLAGPAQQRALSAIAENAHRQMQLIAELLDVARITAGTLRIEATDIGVLEVIHKAVDVVEPAVRAKSLQLDVQGTETMCRADPGRLQQIVWNLLTNAIKFTPAGGRIAVGVDCRNEDVRIEIRDTGRGIRASFLPHVFEPFRQGDISTTRTEGGLGLGLSIVKHLVEAHGGVISADSAGEGQGACFTVRLPASTAVGVLTHTESVNEADSRALLAGVSVLVVDDDQASRDVLTMSLEEAGARVRVSASARDAMDTLTENEADVILADIAMPGQDGYSFIRRIRASSVAVLASTPAIALTSLARDADRADALHAGFQLHLAKPIAPRTLIEAVARLVRNRPAPTNQIR